MRNTQLAARLVVIIALLVTIFSTAIVSYSLGHEDGQQIGYACGNESGYLTGHALGYHSALRFALDKLTEAFGPGPTTQTTSEK